MREKKLKIDRLYYAGILLKPAKDFISVLGYAVDGIFSTLKTEINLQNSGAQKLTKYFEPKRKAATSSSSHVASQDQGNPQGDGCTVKEQLVKKAKKKKKSKNMAPPKNNISRFFTTKPSATEKRSTSSGSSSSSAPAKKKAKKASSLKKFFE